SADPDTLLRHADQAMYQAKEGGRNRYHLFDAEQDQQAQTRRQLLDRLAHGLVNDELVLLYQPKVNLRTGQIVGVEALLRWRHPTQGLLLPGTFLPHVEHHDLIVEIGEWVVRQALAQIGVWDRAGLAISVSVNVAARQLLREDFVDCMRRCLDDFPDVPPGRLELEILESAALENTRHVRGVIEACWGMGVGFALDDFGTGYASLSYLRDIPAETMKIDQSFVRDVLEDSDDLTLVEGIIGLATAFRRTVVAEGVETPEQGVLLMRLGCDIAQGYGIARPMPAEDLPAWIAAYRPDPQWALWADTHWEMSDFPLLVAQYDHIKWVRRILLYMDGAALQLSPDELCDHHQCRFGHWYYGHGRRCYGRLQEFTDLESIHIAVHQVGPSIVELRKAGKLEQAREQVHELLALKDQILEKLSALQHSVAGKSAEPDFTQYGLF
ncbi:MAG: EAL domain-containing protein, partial [Gammaproteobacteria bacterium]|nr:EAL domain-containing protein [Gammaproteobacteria bacterium]